LTIGCTQCHNHPYDPLSQKEFYQFFDFFNHAQDGNNTGPTARYVPGEIQTKEKAIRDQMIVKEKSVKLAKEGKEKKVPKYFSVFELTQLRAVVRKNCGEFEIIRR
jgi:hypothetical protein